MGNIVDKHNIGALGDLKRLSDHGTSTAGGSGDTTTVTGLTIDRVGAFGGVMPESALVGVLFEATLQSGATLSYQYAVQDSADASSWADYQTATYVVAATGASGGSVVKGEFNAAVDLGNARRYVRFNFAPKCSSTGTDTTISDAVGFMAGGDIVPSVLT